MEMRHDRRRRCCFWERAKETHGVNLGKRKNKSPIRVMGRSVAELREPSREPRTRLQLAVQLLGDRKRAIVEDGAQQPNARGIEGFLCVACSQTAGAIGLDD